MGQTLVSRQAPLASNRTQLETLARPGSWPRFDERVARAGLLPLEATGIEIFQINVGKFCNQTCRHCHVDAGPERTEQMTRETAELCIRALVRTDIPTVDITGGAPELNANFRWLVQEARALGRHVMDRCNLSVLLVKPQERLAEFLAEQRVEIIASLPYFRPAQADAQRGEGVFEKSVEALRRLNALGYGIEGSGLTLNLVHNPVGAFLPPAQKSIEALFRHELAHSHGITFNNLYTITNMPISRFLEFLLASGNFEGYMERLANAFNPAAARAVMCRNTISVGWDGTLYDCDFNQMLDLPVTAGVPRHIRDFDAASLGRRAIVTANHCYGCTAGAGSSCGGAVA
ncbi:MAG: arsenosugar biosynthesis radical SAM protein ArsS [Burkholderiales bacterium]|nr:arsenosugar biosynthesis radical SAM protein ArsS [Burkholderiales bacterium]